MKMKIILTLAWVSTWLLKPSWSIILLSTTLFALAFSAFAVLKGFSYLNELPNTLRFMVACVGGLVGGVLGVFLFLLSYFGNDETMRRLYRQKGVIVLTGIDSTGKSTYARKIHSHLTAKGVNCRVLKFDKYLFLEKLSSLRRNQPSHIDDVRVSTAKTSILSFLRPYLALADNILLYISKAFPSIARRGIVICDRFIWDNSIKHKALGYPTFLLFNLSTLLKPPNGIVLDVPTEVAYERVEKRKSHKHYSLGQYETERTEFRRVARILKYPVINTDEPFIETWNRIESLITCELK